MIPHGVVGTGTFSAPDDGTTGTVTITAENGRYYLALSDFRTTEQGELALSFSPWGPSVPCLADEHALSFGDITRQPVQTGLAMGPWTGDPSFFATVVLDRLAQTPSGLDANGCVITPLAFAPIAWTLPDLRPNLHVADSGSRAGARGTVTSTNGVPVSYTVARGDNLNSIGTRFGITVDDIRFLNPLDSMPLRPDQQLNLDRSLRGAGSLPLPSPGR